MPTSWIACLVVSANFHISLNQTTRQMIDAVARGTLNAKMPEESMELFEKWQ